MLEREQVIRFVRVKRLERVRIIDDAYRFNRKLGWVWLQKLCCYILKRIGAFHYETETYFQRRTKQTDDLLKSLIGQEGQWIELVHYNEKARIYMGPDEERELFKLANFMGFDQHLKLFGNIETATGHERPTWHNIPIYVVPWMKGAIIVPE